VSRDPKESAAKPQPAEEALVGRHAVLEALRGGRPISRVLVARTAHGAGALRDILGEARRRSIPVQTVDGRRLDMLAHGLVHQGVAAVAAAQALVDLGDILAEARRRGEPPFLILLDGIEDPHNLGAVIRTAEAAGAHGAVVPRRRAAGLTPAVARAAAGATAHLPIAGVGNMAAVMEDLKRAGVWVVGADPEAEERYDAAALEPPIALVWGPRDAGSTGSCGNGATGSSAYRSMGACGRSTCPSRRRSCSTKSRGIVLTRPRVRQPAQASAQNHSTARRRPAERDRREPTPE
jgi:23S rRNA (guanosine2251-2'-O)-methyltransferase